MVNLYIYTHKPKLKIMNIVAIRRLIKESIEDHLKMIGEAGDKAAVQAKISKIDEKIQEATEIKNAIPASLTHYVDPEIVSDMIDEIEASIQTLQGEKEEYQKQLAEMEKPVKEAKKKPSTGMTKKAKSTVVKKARAGEDIGKAGKGFEKVAAAGVKQYGSKEAGQKVAAASMWKGLAK
jgi:cell division septum initiation protein DivIVA